MKTTDGAGPDEKETALNQHSHSAKFIEMQERRSFLGPEYSDHGYCTESVEFYAELSTENSLKVTIHTELFLVSF